MQDPEAAGRPPGCWLLREQPRGGLWGGPVSVAPGSPSHKGRDVARDAAPCIRHEDRDGPGSRDSRERKVSAVGKGRDD